MRYCLLVCLFFSFLFSAAQRITNFDLFQVGMAVNVKFTLRAGSTCYGYKVMHSLDSVNFIEAVDYPAICGASGTDEYFTNTHSTPALNQYNYYKIQLSTFEVSEIRKIYVGDKPVNTMFVFPNPVSSVDGIVKIRILNVSNLKLEGYVYNQNGTLGKEVSVETQGEVGVLDTSQLENGLHILWLTDGLTVFSAKFILYR